MSGANDKDGQTATLRQVIQEKDHQIEALLAKMDEMKKSLDHVSLQHFDAKKLIE